MKNHFILVLLVPLMFACTTGKETSNSGSHRKEIPASKLPEAVTGYISANLPHAKITKVIRQKGEPAAKYIVSVSIHTRHHTLVFNRENELVKLDGKKLSGTRRK